MYDNGFRNGNINYAAETVDPAELAQQIEAAKWADGFIAFAASENRLKDVNQPLTAEFLETRINQELGYVTEINLWRREGNILHEIAAERVNDRFFVQTWLLDSAPIEKGNCWHKDAETRAGSHHKDGNRLFSGILNTVEVVWPEKRLNFFITRGEV